MRRLKSWFRGLSMTGKVTAVAVAGLLSLGIVGASAQSGTPTPASIQPTQKQTTASPASKVEVKTVTTTDTIPFTSSTIQDATLDQGVTQTQTKGSNGTLTHTYKVTYTNGVETSRSVPVDTITTSAVNEVLVVGTKAPAPAAPSCPNGTYVNSVGDTVCSPYKSSSAPSGATAQCSDGTYSFSQSRSGTCSHHGGVASWL
jgi:uncharacterized protein YabE (DUF348 family)